MTHRYCGRDFHADEIALIRQLIAEGINVNVTLLFGLPRYEEVAEAHIAGLEARAAKGESLTRVASVASFFLSRIDVLVDPRLEKIMGQGGDRATAAQNVRGEVAIASAKMGYMRPEAALEVGGAGAVASCGGGCERSWAGSEAVAPASPSSGSLCSLATMDALLSRHPILKEQPHQNLLHH